MNLHHRIRALGIGLSIFLSLIGPSQTKAQSSASGRAVNSQKPLSTAKAQFARNDLQSAEDTLWSILSNAPENAEALSLLGNIRIRQQRYPEAEALLRRVVQIDPNSEPAHKMLGQLLATQNKLPEAIDQYRAASALAPRDTGLKLDLARLYLGAGQFAEVVSILDSIPPTHLPLNALPLQAAALISLGKPDVAIKLIDRVRDSPAVALALADVYVQAKLPGEALQCLDLVSGKSSKLPPEFYLLKGRALAEKGESDQALAALHEATAADPKSADALDSMAEIYASQNKHAEAIAALQHAEEIDPNSLPVLRHLVVEATKGGEKKIALDSAATLSDKSPNTPEDLYLAGAAMLEENGQAASEVLDKYLTLRPDDANGWMALGIAYVQKEKYEQARDPLEKALKLNPSLAEAEYELALVAKNEAKGAEAIERLQRALQLQPNHKAALRTLGNLYLQTGELEKARDTLEKAESVDSYNSQTQYDLALIYNKLGKTDLARQHMEQFRRLKGSSDATPTRN